MGVPEGVALMSLKRLSESSTSMKRITGKPRMDIVSWRWTRVMTAEPRSWAIWESALFLAWASSCRCSTGCSEMRIRNIQKG